MSLDSLLSERNRIEKDIVAENKKISEANKKIADLISKINNIKRSIKPNISQSTLNSKMRQIEGYEKDIEKARRKIAEFQKKIATLQEKLVKKSQQIQKFQADEQKAYDKKQESIQQMYEDRINALQTQLARNLDSPSKIIKDLIPAHADTNDKKIYDVFISHATEDKKDFVDELVEELRALNINVWYDTSNLKWGHSLRESIDEGLKNSIYGIVVLSPDYIDERKYWTKVELDAIFQKDSVYRHRILPIWHKLSSEDVRAYSPILASLIGVQTKLMTTAGIAYEFKKLLDNEERNRE